MTYRVVAAIAVAAILIAVAGVIAATHHTTTSSIPADQNLKNYQILISNDYRAMASMTTNEACTKIQDTACSGEVARVKPTLQHWLSDLEAYQTPAQYAVLDGELRAHLEEVIAELDATLVAQAARNQDAFDIALGTAQYERGWLDPTSFELEGDYAKVQATFTDTVTASRKSLGDCISGTAGTTDTRFSETACADLISGKTCASLTNASACLTDLQLAATLLQVWVIAFTQNPAPAAKVNAARLVTNDLAAADAALLAIDDALLRNDNGGVVPAHNLFIGAIDAAVSDMAQL